MENRGLSPIVGVLTGAAIGSGVNYAAQSQLGDGNIKRPEVIMGGITGGLTMGRTWIPTVLINTGGSMNTSAFLNDNIGASVAGTAIGSTFGWGAGNLVENLTSKIAGTAVKDTFWQYGKGFSSEFVPLPYGISAPVAGSKVPQVIGATVGAYTQEVSGDYVKNKAKEQP